MNQNEMQFHIVGMNCNHCRMNAEKAIASVPGVESVSVDLDSREARVTGSASMADIRKAVESIGFEVEEKG